MDLPHLAVVLSLMATVVWRDLWLAVMVAAIIAVLAVTKDTIVRVIRASGGSSDMTRHGNMRIEVVGVHPVEAPEPCHLVELIIGGVEGNLDLGDVTQEAEGQPRENWQVPWDEVWLNQEGRAPVDAERPDRQPEGTDLRVAFFFHYLDFSHPLLTPAGPIDLPPETAVPDRLRFRRYEPPC